MMTEARAVPPPCPDPLQRAPRASSQGMTPHKQLYFSPAALNGAMVALISRNTSGLDLAAAQRLSHFPASPLVTLSWFRGLTVGLVRSSPRGPAWEPFGSAVVLAGSQSVPRVSWAPGTGHGYIACFTPDVAHALFGVDLARLHDRFLPAGEVLDASWAPLWTALVNAPDDAATLAVLAEHLGRRWLAVRRPASSLASLRHAGRLWVERLAWQARDWQRTHSQRQVERRIKSFSGRSLRQWQALTQTESLLFTARERYESGQEMDWATLALDEGFADQAHMCRASRRITGFSPTEFARRYTEDESFWLYRLWV